MTTMDTQLTSRVSSRKQAYSFIVKKTNKLKTSDYYRLDKKGNDDNYISLSDLEGLKNGTSDPPPELVVSLKYILQGTTNETEIDKYLVQPFKEQEPYQSSIKNDQ